MDCVTFRKDINAYLNDELTDEELNDFLLHLEECPACRDELEINYIVIEGISLLDKDRADYDLSKAYRDSIKQAEHYIGFKKVLLTFRYIVDTFLFWALLATGYFYVFTLSDFHMPF